MKPKKHSKSLQSLQILTISKHKPPSVANSLRKLQLFNIFRRERNKKKTTRTSWVASIFFLKRPLLLQVGWVRPDRILTKPLHITPPILYSPFPPRPWCTPINKTRRPITVTSRSRNSQRWPVTNAGQVRPLRNNTCSPVSDQSERQWGRGTHCHLSVAGSLLAQLPLTY